MEEAAPESYADSPFIDDIAIVDLPKKFVIPSMRTYDGTSDPQNHVAFYKQKKLAVTIPSEFMQFASSRKLEKRSSDLYRITQKLDDTLEVFLARFNMDKVSIPRCDVGTAVEAFRHGLLPNSDLYGLIQRRDNMRPVVRWPRKSNNPNPRKDHTKWCEFHMDIGHTMEDYFTLRKEVAYLLKAGYLKDLIKARGRNEDPSKINPEQK
ncbi:uncharacterized protein LOC141619861 [Silene latifolia]|uniref:uncharacterized protein LOC141619861 n=1 Tax=Silene latifolia TaxID=37657 RepID=UPI003D776D1F